MSKDHDGDQAVLGKKAYKAELKRLQAELATVQEWLKQSGERIVVLFEGRDAAGKGGAIKRITEYMNPRRTRIAALPAPTEREQTQWYFQRYIAHLPAAGEMVIFDRSWYNRAGVEKVMGFCTPEQLEEFFRQCPTFERMLREDGIFLVKYWFSVSDGEQEKRFRDRLDDPMRRWKLSPMDLEARDRSIEYSKAKDEMFRHTDLPDSPWYVIEADIKKHARINCMSHLLSLIPYADVHPPTLELPKRKPQEHYERPPRSNYRYVPDRAAELAAASDG